MYLAPPPNFLAFSLTRKKQISRITHTRRSYFTASQPHCHTRTLPKLTAEDSTTRLQSINILLSVSKLPFVTKPVKPSFSSLSDSKHFSCILTALPHSHFSPLVFLLPIACIYLSQTIIFHSLPGTRTRLFSNTTVNIAVWFLA